MLSLLVVATSAITDCAQPGPLPTPAWQALIGPGVVLANALAVYLIYLTHSNGKSKP